MLAKVKANPESVTLYIFIHYSIIQIPFQGYYDVTNRFVNLS